MKNMTYKIQYKALAERDIWEIAEYLSEHSLPAVAKFLKMVKSNVESLADMPLMYPKIDVHREYRKMVVGDYVVVYTVNEQACEISIIRVVHGKRNYKF